MNREVHVRFRERLRGKFPRATRPRVLAALVFFTESARLAWLLPLAKLSETAALTALDDLRNRALLQEDATQERWLLPPLAAKFLRLRRPEAVDFAGRQLENEAYSLAVQHGYNNYPYNELEAVWDDSSGSALADSRR